MEKITWCVVKGEHRSIPEGATVTLRGKTTSLSAFIDKDGEVSYEAIKKGKKNDKEKIIKTRK